jgi:predicted Rossmann fold nucleotide-binding protein DprA/Smf involved in DNA uptake
MEERAAWLALAFRTALGSADALRIALGPGPDPSAFPAEVLQQEAWALGELDDRDVRVLTIRDPDYPGRLRGDGAPLVLFVAGRVALLEEEGVSWFGRFRGEEGERLAETLDAGGRAVLVLSKGLLRADSLLRALTEPIENGALALVSAEPPRASWGPARDRRRDLLLARLRGEDPVEGG